jgi:hypothetical protein
MDSDTDYPIIQYETPRQAKDAFLDQYFNDGSFDRLRSAEQAGLAASTVEKWFADPAFFLLVERRLQKGVKRKSSLQESMLENARDIMEGNITDLFEQNPDNGNLVIRNIKSLPRHITSAIKQMDVVRTIVPGSRPPEYQECLRVVMHDKTKVMNIIGDYTDVKNTALKRADSGAPKMVGFSLITAQPTKELEDGTGDGGGGEVHDESGSEGKPD